MRWGPRDPPSTVGSPKSRHRRPSVANGCVSLTATELLPPLTPAASPLPGQEDRDQDCQHEGGQPAVEDRLDGVGNPAQRDQDDQPKKGRDYHGRIEEGEAQPRKISQCRSQPPHKARICLRALGWAMEGTKLAGGVPQ